MLFYLPKAALVACCDHALPRAEILLPLQGVLCSMPSLNLRNNLDASRPLFRPCRRRGMNVAKIPRAALVAGATPLCPGLDCFCPFRARGGTDSARDTSSQREQVDRYSAGQSTRPPRRIQDLRAEPSEVTEPQRQPTVLCYGYLGKPGFVCGKSENVAFVEP